MDVPFYANPDDTHCFQCCLKMALKHFFPEKEFSWRELEEMTNKPEGKWSWPPAGVLSLHEMGLRVRQYSNMDYRKFSEDREGYLKKIFSEEDIKGILANCDIPAAAEDSKKMVDKGLFEKKKLSLDEMKRLIESGCVVIPVINYNTLMDKNSWYGHFVVILDVDDKSVEFHDPGFPAVPNRREDRKLFARAMEYPEGVTDITIICKD